MLLLLQFSLIFHQWGWAEDHKSDNSSSFSRSYCAKLFNIRNHLAFTMTPFYRYAWSPHVTKQTSLMSKVWGFSSGLESAKAGSRILDVNRWPEETEQLLHNNQREYFKKHIGIHRSLSEVLIHLGRTPRGGLFQPDLWRIQSAHQMKQFANCIVMKGCGKSWAKKITCTGDLSLYPCPSEMTLSNAPKLGYLSLRKISD